LFLLHISATAGRIYDYEEATGQKGVTIFVKMLASEIGAMDVDPVASCEVVYS
jgi:hypothetical protein